MARHSALFLGVVVLSVAAAAAQAPQAKPAPQAPPPLTVQPITKSLYLVKGGSGANTAFFIGEKEVFAVDAKMSAASAAGMLAEIKKVTSAPVTTVIITHSDGDHINGLPGFPKGLTIVAHGTCKADMVAAAEALPELKDYIPNKTYSDRLELLPGPAPVILAHFGPAHTSGDTVVLFPAEKAAFVGDLLFVGRDPLIHRHKNGSSFGYVETLGALLALTPAVEVFLSGHADPLGRADVEALRDSMAGKQAKVKEMVAAGKSLAEIKAAFGVVDRPAAAGGPRFPSLVETIYLELTEKK
ncbi:MAG TPA: MBL fold metallo-hydrolase [Candidatus Aminicenantes bacterium]|nr:MBL fold metallo-hydrolase [Candidatus Aminicenantes bacterium]